MAESARDDLSETTGIPPAESPSIEDPSAREYVESARVDQEQDRIMARNSVDGAPPPRATRVAEWRWSIASAALLLVIIAAWTASRHLSFSTVLVGLVLVAALVAAASPVWGAGLMRGSEERDARRQASAKVRRERR